MIVYILTQLANINKTSLTNEKENTDEVAHNTAVKTGSFGFVILSFALMEPDTFFLAIDRRKEKQVTSEPHARTPALKMPCRVSGRNAAEDRFTPPVGGGRWTSAHPLPPPGWVQNAPAPCGWS